MLKNIIAFLALSFLSLGALAQENDRKFTAGVKFGSFPTSLEGTSNGSGPGLQLSYSFSNTLSFDFEYLTASLDSTIFGADVSTDITTVAGYVTYRSVGDAYWLFKIGILRERVSASARANGRSASASESDIGLSLGLGGGYRVNDQIGIEAEYTIIEADLSFMGVTGRYTF